MQILEPIEDNKVERHSSIYQNRGMLAVRRGDEWVPIAFDIFDGVNCKDVKSRKGVLTLSPYIGYQFPVKECRYLSELYVSSDQKGEELKVLPDYYGAGFYKAKFNREVLVNSAAGALGVVNDTTLRVGTDYCLANETIDPVA